ncbi:hypothetical protein ANN_08517 [Periplaneta americana]|uniref:Uncharacterized protein n=1 Tax=Periplaneta americana TaxID=6978 RepID=A0ABQ8T2T3_PERAM|nr:hypothetical protein ANN_08517 [Periplaneta americana]
MGQHRSASIVKMCDEEDILLASAALIIILSANRRKFRKRRFWVRPSLQSRKVYRGSVLMKDLMLEDVDQLNLEYRCGGGFIIFFQMSSPDFETLLTMIGPKISTCDTSYRTVIPANERLAVTLRRFLSFSHVYF